MNGQRFKLIAHTSLLIASFFFLIGCGKEETKKSAAPVAVPVARAKPVPVKKIEMPKFTYRGRRDPFLPSGSRIVSKIPEETETAQVEVGRSTVLEGLTLSGIVQPAKEGKRGTALLSGSGGHSYILQEGKLYDEDGDLVPAIAGVVKENEVLLIAENKVQKLLLYEEGEK